MTINNTRLVWHYTDGRYFMGFREGSVEVISEEGKPEIGENGMPKLLSGEYTVEYHLRNGPLIGRLKLLSISRNQIVSLANMDVYRDFEAYPETRGEITLFRHFYPHIASLNGLPVKEHERLHALLDKLKMEIESEQTETKEATTATTALAY